MAVKTTYAKTSENELDPYFNFLNCQILINGSSYETYFSEAPEGSLQRRLYEETVANNPDHAFVMGYDQTEDKITREIDGKDGVAFLGDFEAEISLKQFPCVITRSSPHSSTLEHTGLPFRSGSECFIVWSTRMSRDFTDIHRRH